MSARLSTRSARLLLLAVLLLIRTVVVLAQSRGGTPPPTTPPTNVPPPAAPSGLVATPTAAMELTVSWTDRSTDETGFEVERKLEGGSFRKVIGLPPNFTTYADPGLTPGLTYTYRVRAAKLVFVDGVRGSEPVTVYSDYSNEVSAPAPFDAPSLRLAGISLGAQSVTGGQTTSGSVTLSMAAPEGGAVVTLASSNPGVATVPASVTVPAGSATGSFTVTTSPVTSATQVVISATFSGTTLTATLAVTSAGVPVAPNSLVAGGVSGTQINLLWSDNSADEVGFELERKTGSGAFQRVATTGTNIAFYSDTGLTAGTTYTYRVRAVNSAGPSGYSSEATASTQAATLTAVTLSPSTVTGGSPSVGTVSYNGPAPSGGALVTLSSSNPALASVPATVTLPAGVPSIQFTITTAVAASPTPVTITATAGSITRTASLTVTPATLPGTPSALVAAGLSPSQINLLWFDNSTDEVRFEVERKTGSGAFQTVATVNANINFFSDTGLSAGTTFVYRVRAVNGFGPSDYSNEATATTKPAALTAISLNPSTVVGGQAVQGTVTLNGPASAGGATVTLTSSNTALAAVPGSINVAAGSTSASFVINTQPVTESASVTIGAAFSGGTQSATLTVASPPRSLPRYRIAVVRPSTREWIVRGDDGKAVTVAFGGTEDLPLPADYLGMGTAQIAVFRPSTREWFIRDTSGTTRSLAFGGPGDLPVPADYFGLKHVSVAIYRPGSGEWFLRDDASVVTVIPHGGPGDLPLPADYLGTGRAQIAVYRPSTQQWFIRDDTGETVPIQFGAPGDTPLPADYLGLGYAQIAVYRPTTQEWFIRRADGVTALRQFGGPGDVPVPGNYAGTGTIQLAVFRPSTREWFLRADNGTTTPITWGSRGDVPVPAAFPATLGP